MDRILLECEYFPCIAWYKNYVQAEQVVLEQYEYFVRASLRNRCYVMGSHGVVCLSVPIKGGRNQKIRMKDIQVAHHDRWQHVHWQTILSAYGRSPYFQYFGSELETFYTQNFNFLLDWNIQSVAFLNKVMRIKKEVILSNDFDPYTEKDQRLAIRSDNFQQFSNDVQYHQVFSDKQVFQPNLSMLDFIFCENDLHLLRRP